MEFNDKKIDPNFIFKTERNIKAYMLYTIIILGVVSISLSLAIMFLTPLKQTKPYLVFFADGESNFVKINEANLDIRSDEALLKNILAGYVKNRETINRINDIERYEITRSQSKKQIWTAFENLVKTPNSIYTTNGLYRDIKILNVSILSKDVATIDFIAETTNKTRTETSYKKYRVALKYDFENLQENYNTAQKNPTGFIVSEYSLSEIIDNEQGKKK